MNWLKKFMSGRYGGDQLSMALLVLSVLLTIVGQLAGLPVFIFIGYIPIGLGVFRMLSKNIRKRSMENYKFSMIISPVYSWLIKSQRRITESKTHKFLKCPKCKSDLRIPKGKGTILVTCPKCKTEFRAKS